MLTFSVVEAEDGISLSEAALVLALLFSAALNKDIPARKPYSSVELGTTHRRSSLQAISGMVYSRSSSALIFRLICCALSFQQKYLD